MTPRPPERAQRILARSLADDPAGRAILGDLHEEFLRIAGTRGLMRARAWYWREALSLVLGRRLAGVPGGALADAHHALRSVARSPGFALFTAGVIGLGVGAATSVFSVLKPLVIAPLPFERPDELVWISNEAEPGELSRAALSSRSANLHDFRLRSRTFAGLTGYNAFFDHTAYTLSGEGEPVRLIGADVAHDFLDVLGVEPMLGRSFSAEEGVYGGPRAVILAHGLWVRQFGSDPSVVGRRLQLDGDPRTVVGVLPPTFDFASIFTPGSRIDFLLPFPVIAAGGGGFQGNTLHLIGRLEAGATPEAAQAELDAILAALAEEEPDRWGLGAVVTPLDEQIAGPFRATAGLLAAAAATLLLLVCVNVSGLMLARAPSRARELAVRRAMGAPRGRLVRQLVLESLGISLVGALVGSGLAWAATGAAVDAAALRIPLMAGAQVDALAVTFACAVAVLTGLAVGIAPALRLPTGGDSSSLWSSGTRVSRGRRERTLMEALVIAEVTLACVLLVVGGLLVQSFRAVLDVDIGYEPRTAVAWQLDPGLDFASREERSDFYRTLAERVRSVPGVEEAGLIDALPLGANRAWPYRVIGDPDGRDDDDLAFPHVVDAGYLATMRTPLVAGRGFTPDDVDGTQPVVLLNESGARTIFGGAPALGRTLKFWGDWEWEVVGIVQDVRHLSLEADAGVQAYFPVAQMHDYHTLDLVVRSPLSASAVAAAVGGALTELDGSMPVRDYWTLESTVDLALSARRFTLGVLGAFGAAALVLAGLGIYGVLARSVAERRAELGIRVALGASSGDVVGGVLRRTLFLASIGTAAGAGLSVVAGWLASPLLFGVRATDPASYLVTACILLGVAGLAAALPARRAVRADGVGALMRDR